MKSKPRVYVDPVLQCDCGPLIAEITEALQAVIGRGYLEQRYPASQDYVSKSAIAKVRAALAQGGKE